MARGIRAVRGRLRLQGLLRQGQSHQRGRLPRTGTARRPAHPGGRESAKASPSSPTSTKPSQAEPAAEVADILQIPAFLCRQTDLLLGRGTHRPHRQHQEGPVRRSARHPPRGGKGRLHRQLQGGADRARLVLRLQQSGGGYARSQDHARCRLAGGLRRHPLGAIAGRRRRVRPADSRSSSSRWRGQPWRPASTASSWKCTTPRRRPFRTAPTPCGSICWPISGGA